MRLSGAVLAVVYLVSLALSQEYSYGQPSDLKALKKVFVDTGPDFKSREAILKGLERSKLRLEVVDDLENAEIVLAFDAGEVVGKGMALPVGTGIMSRDLSQKTGKGYVLVNVRGKAHLVYSFQDVQQSGWERKPVTNFTRKFIKIYKKANDIK